VIKLPAEARVEHKFMIIMVHHDEAVSKEFEVARSISELRVSALASRYMRLT
jgi:hypothetical protein